MHPKTFFKDFFKKDPPLVNAGYIFVAMPFAKEFDPVYDAIEDALERVRESDKDVLGFQCYRADKELGGGIIMEEMLQKLKDAEIVIADLTGPNANVFYELGIAHMIKESKSVLLISQDDQLLFDVRSYRHFPYTIDDLQHLQQRLINAVKTVTPARTRITTLLGDTYASDTWVEGDEDTFYKFSICFVRGTGRSAKVEIKVWSDDETQQPRCEEVVLQPFEKEPIPWTHWAVKLHAVSSDKAEFCICDANRSQT